MKDEYVEEIMEDIVEAFMSDGWMIKEKTNEDWGMDDWMDE